MSLEALRDALGDRVATDDASLDAHRRDTWMWAELLDMEGRGFPRPLAVLRPTTTDEVATALGVCRERGLAVIPYGAGSGVVGGVQGAPEAVVLSLEALAGLVALDDRNLTATFRAGTLGIDAERRVQQEGLTIGHWPQSIELSTVGGWVATRAAGQYSTAYGNIEDVVLDLEAVLPDGQVLRTRRTPRASAGPDLRQLFLGSEGTLGVVTEVTFSLRPLPARTRGQVLHFPTLSAGLEAIRLLMREGWRPPVVRLYDEIESKRQFRDWCPEDRHLLLLVHEGPEALVEVQTAAVASLAARLGGETASEAAAEHWLEHRNQVPTFRELLERGLVVDTIEVASTWDRVEPLYEAVTASLREVPGMLYASAHSSHSYRSGTNLYFTFIARPERERMGETYQESWRRTMEATLASGGGIAHHHGIGRIRREHLAAELGPGGLAALRAVKAALDPDGRLNPGVLLPG